MVDRSRLIRSITPADRHPAGSGIPANILTEIGRLTPRDRYLFELLDQHQTFTTEQLAQLAFGSIGRARERLNQLHGRGVLDRFRHYHRPGSASYRWTVGPTGAALIALGREQPVPRPSAVRESTARLAASPTLAHRLATNGFFVALAAHARSHRDGGELTRWWNEARCRAATGDLVRPDGHGTWVVGGRRVPFWVEVDLGTEALRRVAAKLPGYAALPPGSAYPVLFWLTTTARETNLRAHLTRAGTPAGVTVVTAAADHAAAHGGPAGPVWRIGNRRGRVTLAECAVDGAPWDG